MTDTDALHEPARRLVELAVEAADELTAAAHGIPGRLAIELRSAADAVRGGPSIVVVWLRDGGDYYVGEDAAIYLDGRQVWAGASADAVEDVARAIAGDRVQVREVQRRDLPTGPNTMMHRWPDTLDKLP